MTTNAVTIIEEPAGNPYAIMPVLAIETAMERRQAVVEFTRRLMVAGTDFGVVPGTGVKPTLLKPGAEKLASLFGLSPRFDIMEREMDWTGEAHGGEPFFFFQYRCTLARGELTVGQGVGSCNSWEKKYRWRQGERVCPECGKPAIIRGKEEYGGGWLCFKKRDGCGYKFAATDPRITGQQVGQVKNPNPADVVNTIDKMAQKRALVAAVLIAVNASELFTQDIEDYSDIVEGDWQPAPPKATQPTSRPAAPNATTPPAPPANGNGGNGKALLYEDGTPVGNKPGTLKAYHAYIEEFTMPPASHDTLKEWAAKKREQAPAAEPGAKPAPLFDTTEPQTPGREYQD